MTDFYSQNRCVCSTRSHGPLLCAFCLSFHFNDLLTGLRALTKLFVLTCITDVSLQCVSSVSLWFIMHAYNA